ncbi:hypothetical protein TGMAS_260390C, partial [Toxoplasma gondii MAS]
QSEKSLQYRATLSSSSVPVLIPLPASGSAASPLASALGASAPPQLRLPPSEFFADLKAEVDELLALMRMQQTCPPGAEQRDSCGTPEELASAQAAQADVAEDREGGDRQRSRGTAGPGERSRREESHEVCGNSSHANRRVLRSVPAEKGESEDEEPKWEDSRKEDAEQQTDGRSVRTPGGRRPRHATRTPSDGERRRSRVEARGGETGNGEFESEDHGRRKREESQAVSSERASPGLSTNDSQDLKETEREKMEKRGAHTATGGHTEKPGKSRASSTPSGSTNSALALVQHARDSVMKALFPLQASLASLDGAQEGSQALQVVEAPGTRGMRPPTARADWEGLRTNSERRSSFSDEPRGTSRGARDGRGEEARRRWREAREEPIRGSEERKRTAEAGQGEIRGSPPRHWLEKKREGRLHVPTLDWDSRMHVEMPKRFSMFKEAGKRERHCFGPEIPRETLARLSQHEDCGALLSFLLSAAMVLEGRLWSASGTSFPDPLLPHAVPASSLPSVLAFALAAASAGTEGDSEQTRRECALAETAPESYVATGQVKRRSLEWRHPRAEARQEGHLPDLQTHRSQCGEPLCFMRDRGAEGVFSSGGASVFLFDRGGVGDPRAACADASTPPSSPSVASPSLACAQPLSTNRCFASSPLSSFSVSPTFLPSSLSPPSLVSLSFSSPSVSPSLPSDPLALVPSASSGVSDLSLPEIRDRICRPSQPLLASLRECRGRLSRGADCALSCSSSWPGGFSLFFPSVQLSLHLFPRVSPAFDSSSSCRLAASLATVSPSISFPSSALLHAMRRTPLTSTPFRFASAQRRRLLFEGEQVSSRSGIHGEPSLRFPSRCLAFLDRGATPQRIHRDVTFSCSRNGAGGSGSANLCPLFPRLSHFLEKSRSYTNWDASDGDGKPLPDSHGAYRFSASECMENETDTNAAGTRCNFQSYPCVFARRAHAKTQVTWRVPAGALDRIGVESRDLGNNVPKGISRFYPSEFPSQCAGSVSSSAGFLEHLRFVSPVHLIRAVGVGDSSHGALQTWRAGQCTGNWGKGGLQKCECPRHCECTCCEAEKQTKRTGGRLVSALQSPVPLSPLSAEGLSGGGTPEACDWSWRVSWLLRREGLFELAGFFEDLQTLEATLEADIVVAIEEGAEAAGE